MHFIRTDKNNMNVRQKREMTGTRGNDGAAIEKSPPFAYCYLNKNMVL